MLRLEDAEPPAVGAGDVLIRVAAASVNPYDWHFLRGTPYLVRGQTGWRRPADPGLGVDLAGRVEAVGRDVTRFTPGDEVFGIAPAPGALAEYAVVPQDRALLPKPANLTFEQAAAVPLAALTALQALRGPGRLQPGQQVLVNGAAGGVGTFAVQLARVMGAEVTGVCGPAHTWLVASLGPQRYDLLLDVAGSRPLRATLRALTPRGTLVGIGGLSKGRVLGPMTRALTAMALSPLVKQQVGFFLSRPDLGDLATLRDFLTDGSITPVIDRTYPLADTAAAFTYLEEGHAGGKVIIAM